MAAIHYGRRSRDNSGGPWMIATTKCKTDGEFIEVTRRKDRVTCKKCIRILALDAESSQVRPARACRPATAWDHLDAIPDDHTPTEESEEVAVALPEPPPELDPVPTQVFAGAAVGSADVFRLPEQDPLTHRIALVFFNLMRLHLGIEQVVQIAEMASNGVTGPGRRYDNNMPLAEQLARLVIDPPRLTVNPR